MLASWLRVEDGLKSKRFSAIRGILVRGPSNRWDGRGFFVEATLHTEVWGIRRGCPRYIMDEQRFEGGICSIRLFELAVTYGRRKRRSLIRGRSHSNSRSKEGNHARGSERRQQCTDAQGCFQICTNAREAGIDPCPYPQGAAFPSFHDRAVPATSCLADSRAAFGRPPLLPDDR